MSKELLEKLRKSRQTNVDVGGYAFTLRRLNDFDLGQVAQNGEAIKIIDILKKCVVDWPGMTELKLDIPGGSDTAVAFDTNLFIEWVADRREVYAPLRDMIWKHYNDYKEKQEVSAGESQAG